MCPKLRQCPWFTLLLSLALLLASAPSVPAAALTKLVSIDADETYLPGVLKILAEKGDLNIITGPGVSGGKITIHMKDVPVEQAVNLVVRAAGLAYERIGNSILVAEAKSLREETGLSSYVVSLKFADANDVKAALKGLSEQIEVDRGGNRLIIVTSPRIISEIEAIITELDRPARQVMLEARIVEVSTDDTKELGIDWDQLNRQGVLIVEGNPAPSGSNEFPDDLPYIPSTVNGNVPGLQTLSRQAKAFQVALDMLIREGNARVLANPKLATLNGKEATMLVGQRIPFLVSGTVFAGGGAAPVQSVQREEVGIKLSITPLINADGYITTVIKPEVSSVVGFRGDKADLPVIATRQASTTVRLKDGSSVIIGGLLSEEKTVTITRVPILGSIPGLGRLFQHQTITSTKKDLVIEVTTRILPEQP